MNPSEQCLHIKQSFKLYSAAESVLEVRVLNIPDRTFKVTASGYFDNNSEDAFVDAVQHYAKMKPGGIYAVYNPVKPALLSRAVNRIEYRSKNATADKDIARRHLLMIDMDVNNPRGISSTDAQHEAALERAAACSTHMLETFGVKTIKADSGNGGHLYIPCDLLHDDESEKLYIGILRAMSARFSDDVVHVDEGICNAARLTKIYGTLVRKGDHTEERPHRYSRLLDDVPDELTPVSVDVLRAIADTAPQTPRTAAVSRPASPAGSAGANLAPFDVPAFLSKHNILVHHEEEGANGWHQWALEACPFNPEHKNPDSMVSQQAGTGKVSFKCLHDSCKGKKWQEFRKHYEPGWKPYEPIQERYHEQQAQQNSKAAEAGKAGDETTEEGENVEESADKELPYVETALGLLWLRQTRDGVVKTPLTNFTARIVADVLEDDGAETSLRYHIQARRNGKQTCFTVPADTFNSFGWVAEHLGIGASCYPGTLNKEHAQFAIRQISEAQGATRETTYTHTGWRELQPSQWAYLHAGGVIGASVPSGVNVRLSEIGKHYLLPESVDHSTLQSSIAATLNLAALGPDSLLLPLIAAIFRAAIGTSDFSLSLSGPSGAFKSELAALAQRYYGVEMDANHLPGSWSSTENALEELAFRVKDALLVIDDFAPTGSQHDIARLHAKADRVLRAQGNGSGRQRMRRDGTLYAARPPRGLILSTGEDIPQGKSLRARQFILELGPKDIDAQKLTDCQKDAAAGVYAQCMTGFLTWLAPRYGQIRATYTEDVQRLRAQIVPKLRADGHRRTPDIVADLALGRNYFLHFAQDMGVLTQEEANVWHNRFAAAFTTAAGTQALHQQSSDPALRFLDLIRSALSSGTAHVADMIGNAPETPEAWGWRLKVVGTGDYERNEWQAQGERIGWTEGENLYLEKDAAFKAIRKQGADNEGVPLTPTVLYKRLLEGHYLASTEKHSSRGTLHVRKKAEGKTQNVLHLYSEAVLGEKSDISDIDAEEV